MLRVSVDWYEAPAHDVQGPDGRIGGEACRCQRDVEGDIAESQC